MKFSIIIPIYNTPIIFLKKCINSCLNQSYNNYEIVIINDCSIDNKVNSYLRKIHDKKIKIIWNEKNIGLGPSRNKGIKNSSGDFLLFVDSDDWISEVTLKRFSNIKDIKNYDIISFNFANVFKESIVSNVDYFAIIDGLKINGGSTTWSKLYSRNFIVKNNILFLEKNIYHEDEYHTLSLFKHNPRIYSIDDELYFYNKTNENSIMSTIKPEESLRNLSIIVSNIKNEKYPYIWKLWYSLYLGRAPLNYILKDNINFRTINKLLKPFKALKSNFIPTSMAELLKYKFIMNSFLFWIFWIFRKPIFFFTRRRH